MLSQSFRSIDRWGYRWMGLISGFFFTCKYWICLQILNSSLCIGHVRPFVAVKKSRSIPCCEASWPWAIIGIPDVFVRIIPSKIIDIHRPVEQILCICRDKWVSAFNWSCQYSLLLLKPFVTCAAKVKPVKRPFAVQATMALVSLISKSKRNWRFNIRGQRSELTRVNSMKTMRSLWNQIPRARKQGWSTLCLLPYLLVW